MTTIHRPGVTNLAPTLDQYAAEQAAQAGIATSDDHALAEWKAEADKILARLAHERRTITPDDVWAAGLGPNPNGSNTALGARFRAAAAAGLIVKTDRTMRTTQVASHNRPGMTVWRSLVYAGPEPEGWAAPIREPWYIALARAIPDPQVEHPLAAIMAVLDDYGLAVVPVAPEESAVGDLSTACAQTVDNPELVHTPPGSVPGHPQPRPQPEAQLPTPEMGR